MVARGFKIISGGTDNHLMLIDLSAKNISGKEAEALLGHVDITVNKNMVPFDQKSPFVTSGIRLGTPAVTTRGLVETDMRQIAEWIDQVIERRTDENYLSSIKKQINELMTSKPLFPIGI